MQTRASLLHVCARVRFSRASWCAFIHDPAPGRSSARTCGSLVRDRVARDGQRSAATRSRLALGNPHHARSRIQNYLLAHTEVPTGPFWQSSARMTSWAAGGQERGSGGGDDVETAEDRERAAREAERLANIGATVDILQADLLHFFDRPLDCECSVRLNQGWW